MGQSPVTAQDPAPRETPPKTVPQEREGVREKQTLRIKLISQTFGWVTRFGRLWLKAFYPLASLMVVSAAVDIIFNWNTHTEKWSRVVECGQNWSCMYRDLDFLTLIEFCLAAPLTIFLLVTLPIVLPWHSIYLASRGVLGLSRVPIEILIPQEADNTREDLIELSPLSAASSVLGSMVFFLLTVMFYGYFFPTIFKQPHEPWDVATFCIDTILRGSLLDVMQHFNIQLTKLTLNHLHQPLFSAYVFAYRTLLTLGAASAAGILLVEAFNYVTTRKEGRLP